MRKMLKYGRVAAIAALILVIPLSILFGCNRTVAGMARDVKNVYVQGTEEYGVACTDLQKYIGHAQALAMIAKAYGVESERYNRALDELQQSVASPFGVATASETVHAEASLIYNRLLTEKTLSDDQRNSAILYFAEMVSAHKRLANNKAYNDAAKAYNDVLTSFPAAYLTFGRPSAVIFG